MLTSALRRFRLLCLGFCALLALGAAPAVAQPAEIEIEAFYRELEPYGRWIEHPRYGAVWVPDVDDGWRPYTRGRWIDTEEHGWYWESEEPFAWAVYHYGRWFLDDDEGWVWVPGTEWGPAWVAWRHGDDDVGWAPLPPEAEWRDGEIVLGASFYDSPRFSPAWCFVPVALLTAPRIWSHIHAPRRNTYYLGRTRFLPWRSDGQSRIYNAGIDRRRWESMTGRRIDTRRIVAVDQPSRSGYRIGRSGEISVYRPRVLAVPRDDGRPGFRLPDGPQSRDRRFPDTLRSSAPPDRAPDRRSVEPRTDPQRSFERRSTDEPSRERPAPTIRQFDQAPRSRDAAPSEFRRFNRDDDGLRQRPHRLPEARPQEAPRSPAVRQFPQHQPSQRSFEARPAPRAAPPPAPPPQRATTPPPRVAAPPPQQRVAPPPQPQQGQARRQNPAHQRGQPGQPPGDR